MKIAVLGGGNGAYATVADLAEKGHEISFWRRDQAAFQPILKQKAITLKDIQGIRQVPFALASTDLRKVVKDAELLIAPLPATAQKSLAKELAPFLESGQIIFIPPGTLGSYVMAKELVAAGCRAKVTFAETGTLPYLARKHGLDTVAITTRAIRLPVGIFPADDALRAFSLLKEVYPVVELLQDAMDASLTNSGPIIHPPLILLNAGPIEHFEYWDIHNEGTQPSIRRVHDALDSERISVREALGYGSPHFPLADHFYHGGEEWMYSRDAHDKLVESDEWREHLDLLHHRYMREDIACGLALLVSIAQWAGVAAPVANGLLAIASVIVGEDLRKHGRTLEKLGLAHLTREEMHLLMKEGITK